MPLITHQQKSPTGSSLLSEWRKRTSSDQYLQTENWRTQRWHVINGIFQIQRKIQQNDNEFVQTELKAGRKLASTGAQLLFSCRQLACCL